MSPLTIGENDAADHLTFEPSCKDEMRVGQKNKLTYRWARKGSRPRAARDQRTQSTYLFGAVCPERGAGAAPCCRPATPKLCSFTSMRSQPKSLRALTLFSSSIKPAGMAPRPSRFQATSRSCSCRHAHPNSTAKKISGNSCGRTGCRIFKSFDDIVDHCCYAWNTLIDQPWKIMSIARRDWAAAGHSMRIGISATAGGTWLRPDFCHTHPFQISEVLPCVCRNHPLKTAEL